jgi:hypothetical protein
MDIYGEIHRYIPALALLNGFSVTELVVMHHKRKHGKSKYKTFRIFKGLSDLIFLAFLKWFGFRPTYAFNFFGIITMLIGSLSFLYLLITSFILKKFNLINRLSFFLTVLMILSGIQFIILGVMSEMLTKIVYDIRGKKFYKIEEIINK